MRIVCVVGTRPNMVKMAPVIGALRRRFPDWRTATVHTGQHYDRLMSEIFLDELGMPEPDHVLGVGSGSHAEQIARVLERLQPVLAEESPDLVLVPGDVNSTLGAALCADKMGIPVGHVESGLRSFDRSMPEETNRIGADHLSALCFLHSEEAIENLRAEGVGDERMKFVGNTMIDTLVTLEERIRERDAGASVGVEPGTYLLVTLHRPALVDGPMLADAVDQLARLAREMPVFFPAHPRTRKAIERLGLEIPAGLEIVEPLGYLEFLNLLSRAAAVLTDSGGIQEEATFLGIPCATLRDNTERPVTVSMGTNVLLGLRPDRIGEVPALIEEVRGREATVPPLWDGAAAPRIVEVLRERR